MANKFVFVTGGVCSSLGKGMAAASIGMLLEAHQYRVSIQKADPYINVDAGTMSPFQHGEVFVTEDGTETDLDLGNYSRFTNAKISGLNSITAGQIYQAVIAKERRGDYLGKCVQVIPHITDEIRQRIYRAGTDADVAIIEIGGTVGDIESIPFLEAVRQIILERGHENAIIVQLSLVPQMGGELKTKLTQHAVKESLSIGLQPDILLCRSPQPLSEELKRKVALFTNISRDFVVSAHDTTSHTYRIPLDYCEQKLDLLVLKKLGLETRRVSLEPWIHLDRNYREAERTICIAMVGKYVDLPDAYKSIDEALVHATLEQRLRLELKKIDSGLIEERKNDLAELFAGVSGILLPGGFGPRGIEGMIKAVEYARTNQIPFFGICLGMQIMVIEFARHVLGLREASSTEFVENTPEPVISLLEEQGKVSSLGGSMRLGSSRMDFVPGSKFAEAYGAESAFERHRHRYEVNNRYLKVLEEGGLKISAFHKMEELVEGCEWTDHPWGLGMQAHPEFNSKPIVPHPLFRAFIQAGLACPPGEQGAGS